MLSHAKHVSYKSVALPHTVFMVRTLESLSPNPAALVAECYVSPNCTLDGNVRTVTYGYSMYTPTLLTLTNVQSGTWYIISYNTALFVIIRSVAFAYLGAQRLTNQ